MVAGGGPLDNGCPALPHRLLPLSKVDGAEQCPALGALSPRLSLAVFHTAEVSSITLIGARLPDEVFLEVETLGLARFADTDLLAVLQEHAMLAAERAATILADPGDGGFATVEE